MHCRGLVLLAPLLLGGPALADNKDYDQCFYWRLGKSEAEKASRRAACDRVIADKSYTPAQRADAHAELASWDAEDHRRKDAIANLDQALALTPSPLAPARIKWLRDRGFHLYFDEQYDRAIKDFDAVLVAKPEDAQVVYFRGLAWLDKGDETRGFADLAKGVALAPTDYWYLYQRAVELAKRGRTDEALPDLDKAISVKGDVTNPYLLRADIYEKRGEFDKAIADLTRVAEIDPKSISPYLNRANIYEKMGQLDGAIAEFDKLISLNPGDQYYVDRKAALSKKLATRTDRPAPAPPAAEPIVPRPQAPPTKEPEPATAPEPEARKRAAPQSPPKKEAEKTPAAEHECRRFDAIANRTISVACPD